MERTVKAWAVINKKGIVYDTYLRHRPLKDEKDRPWIFPYNRQAAKLAQRFTGEELKVVPCTITYTV